MIFCVLNILGKEFISDIDCEKIGTFLVYLWIIAEFRVWILKLLSLTKVVFKSAKFTGNLEDLNTKIETLKREAQRKSLLDEPVRFSTTPGKSPVLFRPSAIHEAVVRYNIPIGDIRSISMLGTHDAQGFEIILDY